MKKISGFTIIEMVVVVSVLAVVMITITSMLLNSFKARNRVGLTDTLEQNGSYILSQITNDFLNSDGSSVGCPAGNILTLVNKNDGVGATIQCNDNADIALKSAATTFSLTQGVTVSNCGNFVSCDTDASGKVTAINIAFTLSSGTAGSGVENTGSRSFQTKVAARN